jgi:MFS superfamily sulfate permease-like transporter
LSDAVTIGLYHTLLDFADVRTQEKLSVGKVLVSLVNLLAIGVMGLLIGILFGLLAALLTKTTKHVRGAFDPPLKNQSLKIRYIAK